MFTYIISTPFWPIYLRQNLCEPVTETSVCFGKPNESSQAEEGKLDGCRASRKKCGQEAGKAAARAAVLGPLLLSKGQAFRSFPITKHKMIFLSRFLFGTQPLQMAVPSKTTFSSLSWLGRALLSCADKRLGEIGKRCRHDVGRGRLCKSLLG